MSEFFRDFPLIYQIRYNGLDLNRFCAPEHIIQMSHSPIFWPFGEKQLFNQKYYFYNIFINSWLMGWILIGFALLNTLYKCQIHRFVDPLVKNNFLIRTTFFSEQRHFFRTRHFSLFLPNPYTRMCISTIESLSLFREIVKNHGELLVRSWFWGFSLIFDFSRAPYWNTNREYQKGIPIGNTYLYIYILIYIYWLILINISYWY